MKQSKTEVIATKC